MLETVLLIFLIFKYELLQKENPRTNIDKIIYHTSKIKTYRRQNENGEGITPHAPEPNKVSI